MNPATIGWRRNFNPRIFRPRSSSQAAASAGVGCRRKDRASSSLRASMAARRVMGGGGRTSRRAWLMTLHRRESARSCVLAQEVLARTGQRVGVIGAMATPQGLLPYTIEVVDDDATLTGHAGLPLVLETMRALGVSEVLDDALGIRRRNHGATDAQKAEALVLLMAAGGESVDDIGVLRADKGLQRLCGPLPSADVLLTFLYAFHDESVIDQAQRERPLGQVAYIPKESAPLAGLSRGFGALIHALAERTKVTRATLDHDATIQESHKRQALAHYKGGRGYQPAAIHWAELDVVVADEYRADLTPQPPSPWPSPWTATANCRKCWARERGARRKSSALSSLLPLSLARHPRQRPSRDRRAGPGRGGRGVRSAGKGHVHRRRVCSRGLAEGCQAAPLRGAAHPQEAGAPVRRWLRHQVPRRRQQPGASS